MALYCSSSQIINSFSASLFLLFRYSLFASSISLNPPFLFTIQTLPMCTCMYMCVFVWWFCLWTLSISILLSQIVTGYHYFISLCNCLNFSNFIRLLHSPFYSVFIYSLFLSSPLFSLPPTRAIFNSFYHSLSEFFFELSWLSVFLSDVGGHHLFSFFFLF